MKDLPAIAGGSPVRTQYLVFGSPSIGEEEIAEVCQSMRSGWVGTGPKVKKFEEMFKKFKNCRYAIAVSSCTAALHLSLLVLEIKPGHEVITSPLTFASTANSIVHAGARPVFADVTLETMNIDPVDVERRINKKTKAIIPVHLSGRPCEMDALMELASRFHLCVVEDAAHAIESSYKGKPIGTMGDLGCFSFYVTKNITTVEGGMVVTDQDEFANRIKSLALHGLTEDAWQRFSDEGFKHYQVVCAGFKYNMTDIQASIGIHQLEKIETKAQRRKEIWEIYNQSFRELPLILPFPMPPDQRHAYHLYTPLLDLERVRCTRDEFLQALHKEKIGAGIHYISLHLHPFYQETYGYRRGEFPNAEFISDRTFSLPFSANLTDQDVEDVIKAVKKILEYYHR
ncbi:MAG: DegT/DnrJ/EryC1/StrS aminotransferase family protein [Thermodesulfobacteriota bacterium]